MKRSRLSLPLKISRISLLSFSTFSAPCLDSGCLAIISSADGIFFIIVTFIPLEVCGCLLIRSFCELRSVYFSVPIGSRRKIYKIFLPMTSNGIHGRIVSRRGKYKIPENQWLPCILSSSSSSKGRKERSLISLSSHNLCCSRACSRNIKSPEMGLAPLSSACFKSVVLGGL